MKVLLCLFLVIAVNMSLLAQCFERNSAFDIGEVLNYEIYYNWGFVWLNAGYVDFSVKEKKHMGKELYHFDAYGATYSGYDWIYKVRDHYQAYLDKEMLLPVWFMRENYEGGFEVNNHYIFNQEEKVIYSFTQNSDMPYREDTLTIDGCTYDLLSIIYNCRNMNFDGLAIGDSIPVRTLIDNEFYNLYIRYLGRETIENRLGGQYNCIKFSALLVEGTIFKGGEDLFVWVTDDKNRIPVLVKAKILVGSVKAYLKQAAGLRN